MRVNLNKTVGIACLSTLLQVGVFASDVSDKGKAEAKPESLTEPVGPLPKVGIKNPILDLKVIPSESKIESRGFEAPASMGTPISFRATAYALQGRTRSGAYVRRGVIAADPRILPLGSVVQLQAGDWSGVYTVHDTGGRIRGNIIDVWVPTTREARHFGRRSVKVHILRFGSKGRSAK